MFTVRYHEQEACKFLLCKDDSVVAKSALYKDLSKAESAFSRILSVASAPIEDKCPLHDVKYMVMKKAAFKWVPVMKAKNGKIWLTFEKSYFTRKSAIRHLNELRSELIETATSVLSQS